MCQVYQACSAVISAVFKFVKCQPDSLSKSAEARRYRAFAEDRLAQTKLFSGAVSQHKCRRDLKDEFQAGSQASSGKGWQKDKAEKSRTTFARNRSVLHLWRHLSAL